MTDVTTAVPSRSQTKGATAIPLTSTIVPEEALELDLFDLFDENSDVCLMETPAGTEPLETSSTLVILPTDAVRDPSSIAREGTPDPLLTSEQPEDQAHTTTPSFPLRQLSNEQEHDLIERARSGNQAARDEIVLSLLPQVKRFATRYFLAHAWHVAGRVSPDDLVSEASLRMLERFSGALAARNPCAYLLAMAYWEIRHAMWRQASPIRTPNSPGVRPKIVMSLHASLDADSDTTLLDVLAADDLLPPAPQDERDFTPLYQAALSLSETERAVLAEWYGLYEIAPASLDSIVQRLGRAGMDRYKSNMLTRLYRRLAPTYPQYCGNIHVPEQRKPVMSTQVALSESQKQRLDAAYAHLQQSGQKITVRGLIRAAGVSSTVVSSYLHQQDYLHPGRQQRLDAAYAHLQQSGQKITGRLLAQHAHVESGAASAYLHQQRCHESPTYRPRYSTGSNGPDGAARLAQAYAHLQQSSQPISIAKLGQAAHVRWEAAASYLHQMQATASSN